MKNNLKSGNYADQLLFLGIVLFLLGLLTGLFIPLFKNPRMGLSAHLEAALNGMLLVLLGLIWGKIQLKEKWLTTVFWLTVYGSFANFLAVSVAAVTGAGKMMPIAGGKEGYAGIEGLISFLLVSLSLAMIGACILISSGLYKNMRQSR